MFHRKKLKSELIQGDTIHFQLEMDIGNAVRNSEISDYLSNNYYADGPVSNPNHEHVPIVD